jgi:hypothetical protein
MNIKGWLPPRPSPAIPKGTKMNEITDLIERLDSHMGLQDASILLRDCRLAAKALTDLSAALAAAEAQPVASTADGWVMVPVEPTESALDAIVQNTRASLSYADARDIYCELRDALLYARPTPSVDTEARRRALEEAAKISESTGIDNTNEWPGETWIAQRIAAAIRALIPQEGKADV